MNTSYQSPVKQWFAQNNTASVSPILLFLVLSMPVVFIAGLVAIPGDGSALRWFDDSLLFIAASVAAIATLAAALRYRGTSAGLAWTLIGVGMVSMAFGEGAWGVQEQVLGQDVNSPAIADIGYLGFYVPVFLGLLAMPQAPVTGLRRVRLMMDLAIPVGAISLLSFHLLISDLVRHGSCTTGSAINVAYPLLDLAVVVAAIVLVARGSRNLTNLSVALVTAGFVCIASSDTFYVYLSQIGNYDSGSYFDTGWVIGYALIAVAGMLAARRQFNLDTFHEDSDRPPPLWHTTVLHTPLIPVAALLFLDPSGSQLRVDIAMMIGFVCLVCLAIGREIILQFEHDKAYRHMEDLTLALQGKVQVHRLESLQRVDPGPEHRQPRW